MNTTRIATLLTIILSSLLFGTGCAVETAEGESVDQAVSEVRRPGRFELFRGQDEQFYFNLRAGNGEIILQSEGYTRKASAENGIESVKTNAVDPSAYKLHQAADGQWYFNLRAGNYQVIGTSELYTTKYSAEQGMETVRRVVTKMLRLEAAEEGGAGFDLFVGNDDQFYFNLKAANHEIVLQSEGYASSAGALGGIESVRLNGRDIDNYDILEASDGSFYFNLVAANGEIIGTSEMYASRYNAERGAQTVADLLFSERVADPQ